jgi:hypothetical protein
LRKQVEKRKTLAALALDVDGVRYSADKLIASGEKLKKFGVDLGDAMQMVRELARAGVPQDDSLLGMDKTLEYAARLAQATGTEAAGGIQTSQGRVARHGRRSEEVRDRPAKPAEHRSIQAIRDATEAGNLVEARTLLMRRPLRESRRPPIKPCPRWARMSSA